MTLRLIDRYELNADDLGDSWGTLIVRCNSCGDHHDASCPDDVPMIRTRDGWTCGHCYGPVAA